MSTTIAYQSRPAPLPAYSAPGPAWRWAVRLAAVIALGIAGYTLWVSLDQGATPAGCDPGSGCGTVLASRWSKWLTYVPVSALAAPVYLGVLVASLYIGRRYTPPRQERAAWMALVVLSVLCVGAAVWFVVLQYAVLRSTCVYCLTAHACGLVIAALVLFRAPVGRTPRSTGTAAAAGPPPTVAAPGYAPPGGAYAYQRSNPFLIRPATFAKLLLLGLVGVGVLIGGQFVYRPAKRGVVRYTGAPATSGNPTDKSPTAGGAQNGQATKVGKRGAGPANGKSAGSDQSKKRVPTSPEDDAEDGTAYSFGDVRVEAGDFPVVGPEDEPATTIAVMADYTCHHCRSLHHHLDEAREAFGEDAFTVIAMPLPLSASCNTEMSSTPDQHRFACDLAKLALAVWRADPKKFAEFDRWLFEPRTPPTPAAARAHAAELVGFAELKDAEKDPWVDQTIKRSVRIYGRSRRTDPINGGRLPQLRGPAAALPPGEPTRDELFDFLQNELGLEAAAE